jgi:YggT family protein
MTVIFQIIDILLQVASTIIFAQAILSLLIAFNVIGLQNEMVRNIWNTLDRMTEPLYRPIRRLLPDTGTLDMSPMIVLVIIWILRRAILPALYANLMGAS